MEKFKEYLTRHGPEGIDGGSSMHVCIGTRVLICRCSPGEAARRAGRKPENSDKH